MITRRPITCCILSALLFASCSAISSPAPERVIQVKVLGDVSLRARNSRWTEEVRGLVEAASDYYEREFGVRLVTQSVSAWPVGERIRGTPELLTRLEQDFPQTKNHDYDLVIAFTAEGLSRYTRAGRPRVDRIGNCQQGLGAYAVVPVGMLAVNPDEGPLILSTIHSAKGLEWNSVFIIWALEGRFPSIYNTNTTEELEEERRLLYVAATRAKQNLFISYPTRVFDKSLRMVLSRPSQFVDGISHRLLEPVSLVPEASLWSWES
jgi:hypothetical protein